MSFFELYRSVSALQTELHDLRLHMQLAGLSDNLAASSKSVIRACARCHLKPLPLKDTATFPPRGSEKHVAHEKYMP